MNEEAGLARFALGQDIAEYSQHPSKNDEKDRQPMQRLRDRAVVLC